MIPVSGMDLPVSRAMIAMPLTPEVRETWRRQKATLLENDAEIIN